MYISKLPSVVVSAFKNTEQMIIDEGIRPIFPFTAIIGQDEMKLSLILNIIDPKIGGVIIMGDRGTGKSTTVRALLDLLPEIKVVSDDPFNSDPEDPENISDFVREKFKNNEPLLTKKKKLQWLICL